VRLDVPNQGRGRAFRCTPYDRRLFLYLIRIEIYPPTLYTEQKIKLYKQEYQHPTYQHPNFQPYMSILDLLFYELPNTLEIIHGGRKWILMNEEMA